MTTTAAQAWVADLYDTYVTSEIDVPFFIDEVRITKGPVLELMAGTGRVSLPLAEAGADLTCVDLSEPMMVKLREKFAARGLAVDAVTADVAALDLKRRDYSLALLPFQSFAELLTVDAQRDALARVAAHLAPGGRLVVTLHNPPVRRRSIDGQLRLTGRFALSDGESTLLLWSQQQRASDDGLVSAMQFYEIYNGENRLVEKRWLDVKFRLIERGEFAELAEMAGFRVAALFGDYDRAPFIEETSPFMIWCLEK